jgi:hypothetical protein
MSADLKDFRCKITGDTVLALEAEALAFDRDKADIAREVLDAWAHRKIHECKVLARLMRDEGISGALEGRAGDPQ